MGPGGDIDRAPAAVGEFRPTIRPEIESTAAEPAAAIDRIPTPLPDISAHVMDAEFVGQLGGDGLGAHPFVEYGIVDQRPRGIVEGPGDIGGVVAAAVGEVLREESAAGGEVPLGLGGEPVAVGAAAERHGGDIACFVGGVAIEVNGDEAFAFAAGVAPFHHFEPIDIAHGVVGGGAVAGIGEVRVAVRHSPIPDILPPAPSDLGDANAEAGHGISGKPRRRGKGAALDKGEFVPEVEAQGAGGGAVRGGGGNGDGVIPGEGRRAGDGARSGVDGQACGQAAGAVGGRAAAGGDVCAEVEPGGAIGRGRAGNERPGGLDDQDQAGRDGVVGIRGLDRDGIAAGGGRVSAEAAGGGVDRQSRREPGGVVGNRIGGSEGLVDRGCGQLHLEGRWEAGEDGDWLHDADGKRFGVVGGLAVRHPDRGIRGAARGGGAGDAVRGGIEGQSGGKAGGIGGFKIPAADRVNKGHAPGGIDREGTGDPGKFGIPCKTEPDGRVGRNTGFSVDREGCLLGGPAATHAIGLADEFPDIAVHVVEAEFVRGLGGDGARLTPAVGGEPRDGIEGVVAAVGEIAALEPAPGRPSPFRLVRQAVAVGGGVGGRRRGARPEHGTIHFVNGVEAIALAPGVAPFGRIPPGDTGGGMEGAGGGGVADRVAVFQGPGAHLVPIGAGHFGAGDAERRHPRAVSAAAGGIGKRIKERDGKRGGGVLQQVLVGGGEGDAEVPRCGGDAGNEAGGGIDGETCGQAAGAVGRCGIPGRGIDRVSESAAGGAGGGERPVDRGRRRLGGNDEPQTGGEIAGVGGGGDVRRECPVRGGCARDKAGGGVVGQPAGQPGDGDRRGVFRRDQQGDLQGITFHAGGGEVCGKEREAGIPCGAEADVVLAGSGIG